MEKCDEKDIEIRDIYAELERNNEKFHMLQNSLGMNLTSYVSFISSIHNSVSIRT